MIPIPAIDIRDGRCVRLVRGNFEDETIFGDPIEQALAFAQQGAAMVHIVDLDAARTGKPVNEGIVSEIVRRLEVPVQFGGGVRSAERAEQLLGQGVNRVVIGTLAVEDPQGACRLADRFPGQIVAGLDHQSRGPLGDTTRFVKIRGWEKSGGIELDDALGRLAAAPFAGAVITDISRDGTLLGPDVVGYSHILSVSALPIIASGGVGTLSDLDALGAIEALGRSLDGVIIGRAILSGAFSLSEAVAACAR
ncbi:MAG TPA: 1-(5-phosphoribosyl)-5-[(5-phosphoribosylamino)methylideneamino] imidazole-4-carboxamide isomerase [Acidimicrobiales bacterium]|nr:1-(5-phosphoribosyl)-5-[(5-phosphoribosylamino)methylideneamino] imidazole-4-carboxamide isomerase [Acidimicrobiales bacterium]